MLESFLNKSLGKNLEINILCSLAHLQQWLKTSLTYLKILSSQFFFKYLMSFWLGCFITRSCCWCGSSIINFFETISTLFLMLKNMLNSMNLRNACVKKPRSSLCTLVFQQLYEHDSFLKYFCVKNFCSRAVVVLIIPVLMRRRQEDFCEFKTSLHWETLSQD